ncbi:MAG: flagellar brake protein [Muribaculum sp.]|nr:flagellar brake protein [Muribaculum sp.]
MLSKIIALGDKIELQSLERGRFSEEERAKVYYSRVHEILSEDTLEITMPMEQTKLILLPVDSEYDLVFYGETGLYQCFARIVDRYKSNNIYLLRLELTSNLRKYQRREYYRFSCALEMCSRNLEEEEMQALERQTPYVLQPGLPLRRSVVVDISGGGLRFMSSQRYEPGSLIYCNYHLVTEGENKLYEVIGKVLAVNELEQRPGTFEHRVQYYNMDVETREQIIKFIFEEERKNRKREKMLD